ncbi:MAG: hypothetical protein ACK5IM_08255 [Demequina sp.]|uniref:hypothetical protein n=1 Tax=Demequina sp. TaxID=2050685 RepID=UPI003A8C52F0
MDPLNQWVASEDHLTTRAYLTACATLSETLRHDPRHSHVIGGDLGLVNDATVLTVAHLERGSSPDEAPTVVLDYIERYTGSRAAPKDLRIVATHVAALCRGYGFARVAVNPHKAPPMLHDFQRVGVKARPGHTPSRHRRSWTWP